MDEKTGAVKGLENRGAAVPPGYAELIYLASKLRPDEVRAALRDLPADNDGEAWAAKAKELLLKLPPQIASIEIRLLVTAQPGLSHAEVANYIRTAVENYSGCLRGDDPCRSIIVMRVQQLGWIDVEPVV